MAEEDTCTEKEPAVIKFAFKALRKLDDEKWAATCRHCNNVLTDKYRTTSAFTSYLLLMLSFCTLQTSPMV